MPELFPPEIYDELSPRNPRSQVVRRAVKWFTAGAFPDLTTAPFGDMGGRVGLATYPLTAEIGYRYLGLDEVGEYRTLRAGSRGLTGLVYGADTIVRKPVPYRSVRGGKVHDWFYHGVGEEPVLSIPMESRTGFERALYVMRGETDYKTGAADDTFTATWRIPAEPESEYRGRRRDVFSRVTVAGVPGQTALPVDVQW